MANGIVARFDADGASVRRPWVSRALAGWAGTMALIAFLSALGVRSAAGSPIALAAGIAMTVFAVRALRAGVITIGRSGVIARTLLRSASVTCAAARFEVVQRRGPGYTPYCALVLLGRRKPVLLREFSTGITNRRCWLDSLAAHLNAVVSGIRGDKLPSGHAADMCGPRMRRTWWSRVTRV